MNARTTRGRSRGVLLPLDAEAEEEGAAAQKLGGRRRAAMGVRRCGEGRDATDPRPGRLRMGTRRAALEASAMAPVKVQREGENCVREKNRWRKEK